ncbi:MAG: sulfatase-like hydrolase/transferase [Bacteroidia bacterium]|nr:sulfatase-like hydrolase/transferase [Bacteroidia bacterium]
MDELKGASFTEVFPVFWQALYLDTSMACYFLWFSFLIFSVYVFIPSKIIATIHKAYILILLIIFSLMVIAELDIYNEWGVKINVKAIHFLAHPQEVINSSPTSFLLFGLMAVAVLTYAGVFIYNRISPLAPIAVFAQTKGFKKISIVFLFVIVSPVALVLGIRGGIQQIPIQQSDAYFSKYNVLNLAAVNSGWNMGQSIWENKKNMEGNPYIYFSADSAKKAVQEIYKTEKDTTISFLKTNRPNVVLVILESWSADMIKSLGGYDSAATNFDLLASEGIMFDSIYASGDLSDQGMTAIFSGFPALPAGTSIIGQPGKYNHLPCLNTEFHNAGYKTSYMFGGQLSYGNIKAYMYYNNFDRILEGKDFDSNIPRGKLGVHDEYLYTRQLKELKNEKEPFFAGMFTLSSHSPYDMPMQENDKVKWGADENDYVNSIRYADLKLFEFIQSAKKEKWFNNTLFVFVSDHSHRSPHHWDNHQPEYRKIAMMFYGNVIKDEFRGYRYKKIGSQLDIASTLLHQLGMPAQKYIWSKNLFNPYSPQFAFYECYDGFGWVRPNQYLVYSHTNNLFPFEKTIYPSEKFRMEKEGKSFLQTMFQEYADY